MGKGDIIINTPVAAMGKGDTIINAPVAAVVKGDNTINKAVAAMGKGDTIINLQTNMIQTSNNNNNNNNYNTNNTGPGSPAKNINKIDELQSLVTREESFQKECQGRLQDQSIPTTNKLEYIQSMVMGVRSPDSGSQLEATTQLRELLSIELNPPIEEIIQSGIVPCLVDFLSKEDCPQLQFEAAWALTNIASGTSENTKVVIELEAVPKFIELLDSPSEDVREQAVWALGNFAGDCPRFRDVVLKHGALSRLLEQLKGRPKHSMLINATWALSNFCQGEPQKLMSVLRALADLIKSDDEEILTNACCALLYLSDGTNDRIRAVIEAGVCPRLVELLWHPSPSVIIPALRTVGNIVSGDDMQTQDIINLQALPCILNFLTNDYEKSIKKEACWTISNITAGNEKQIQAVIEANIIGPLVHLLQKAEFDVKKEAAWAISNATGGGTGEQIKYLTQEGCIKPLCDLLTCPDPRTVKTCLKGLENILKVGEANRNLVENGGVNDYATLIDEAGGLEKIQKLKNHDHTEIRETTVKMLETYWVKPMKSTKKRSRSIGPCRKAGTKTNVLSRGS